MPFHRPVRARGPLTTSIVPASLASAFALALGALAPVALAADAPSPAECLPQSPTLEARTRVGVRVEQRIDSAHPYAQGERVWEIHHPGATYVKPHFSRFELAPGDRLEIASPDGRERYFFTGEGYKGKGEDFWGNSVLGDRAILRLQSVTGGAWGFAVDSVAVGTEPLLPPFDPQSVCGPNDWADTACWESEYPTEVERARSGVVVLYNGTENCSGVKIGCPNQFLTNEHCVTSQADVNVTEVRFEYRNASCGGGGSSFSQSYLGDQLVQDGFTLDYSVFTALGVSDDYEPAEFDPRLPPVGERIYITGHPAGLPQKLSIEDSQSPDGLCRVDLSPTNGRGVDTDIGYFCDTTGGSSGSPVWSGESHKLIALHHFGGCANGGVRIDLIYDQIEGVIASCCELVPSAPTLSAEVVADNEVDLAWNDSDQPGTTAYRVGRSRLPGGPYETVAVVADTSPGAAGGPDYAWIDPGVSGGTSYWYVVEATDGATCTSDESNEVQADATGACTLPPVFAGLQTANAPAQGTCAVELFWGAGTSECGGDVAYNVYRSEAPDFEPGLGNRIAAGVVATQFVDVDQLVDGRTYRYIVRAVDTGNGSEDRNRDELVAVPAGSGGELCATGSSCADNPFVDVTPEGPLTVCRGDGPDLQANVTAGGGTFLYQWVRDGQPVAGADGPTYRPDDLGEHDYNALVRSATCETPVFDGLDTRILRVDRPFFGGLTSATNPQDETCTVELAWQPATTVCDGPISYYVYRSTSTPVAAVPANLVAAGLPGTSWTDTAGLQNEETYHYLVRAHDASTGQLDTNAVQIAATPDGPGNGIQPALRAEFPDPTALADWTVTTGPGPHNCGAWEVALDSDRQPAGGTAYFAGADSFCGGQLLPLTSATLTSPPVDLTAPNIQSVAFEVDVRYETDGVDDDASVEIWDGAQWVALWNAPNGDVDQRLQFNVTAAAQGLADFRVRFDYQNANGDGFFSVDDVDILVDRISPCATAAAGPPPVPAGSLRADRADAAGQAIDVVWDASTCAAAGYDLVWGALADVATWTVGGSACGLGTSGVHAWSGVPAGDLWFLVVGSDGAGTESSWGRTSALAERNGYAASGVCGATSKDASGVCAAP